MAERVPELLHVDPDRIDANPENPRLIFREREMRQLLESIREVGVKVPLSIYQDGQRYVLLDGERRWRCAQKLNLDEVPVVIHPKPTRLENILTMFNIHNVRVDWDLMPMALKLDDVRKLLIADAKPHAAKDLSGITGVALPTVRRALELLALPKHYRDMLLKEATKPHDQQRIKPDLFIEINKALGAIERYVPDVFEDVPRGRYRDAMVRKYQEEVVDNVVNYRQVSRIARAERAGEDPDAVIPVLVRLAERPRFTIDQAYAATVEQAYEVRDISTRTVSLLERLTEIRARSEIPKEVRTELEDLRKEIDRLLGDG